LHLTTKWFYHFGVVLPIWRFLGSIIGGLLAGIVMKNYFPDAGYSFKTG
jgi:hypothetical protein